MSLSAPNRNLSLGCDKDSSPETLIASALADANRRGLDTICLFLGHAADPELIRRLLDEPRINSVGTKDEPLDDILPQDLRDSPRVGLYWEPGDWILPPWPAHVYFLGSWRLFTVAMMRHAMRRGTLSLRIRFGRSWLPVPLTMMQALYYRMPFVPRAIRFVWRARSLVSITRRGVAQYGSWLLPEAIAPVKRIGDPAPRAAPPMDHVFAHVMKVGGVVQGVPGRVVHVCGNLQPGGAERQLAYTLKGLAGQDLESIRLLCHNLTRGTDRQHDFYLPVLEQAGIGVREVNRRTVLAGHRKMPAALRSVAACLPGDLATDIINLYWEFVEIKPEVVHSWLDWDNVRAGVAAVMAGVPKVILSCRNINPSHFSLYQPYMDPAYRVLAQISTVTFLNNSRAGADDYADWLGIPRDRISVIYNGVDFGNEGRLPADAMAQLRQSHGIPARAFVVGGVFRLEEEKRPLLWVETAAIVAREIKDAWFIVFGQGRLQRQMLRRAKQLGLQRRFVLAGVTSEVLRAMSMMDVLLLASRGEGLPNVLLEAQWVGTPVVTADVGGAREAIDPGVSGWAVDSDRAIDLAHQVIAVGRNPGVLAEACRRGPLFVRERFGVARMIAETMKVYGRNQAQSTDASNRRPEAAVGEG